MSRGFPPSGSIFYRDDYGTLYDIIWETVTHGDVELIDFTTVTKMPYVWDQPDEGYIQGKQVFRRGICSTIRQILQPIDDGYSIVAEGGSSVVCTFQTTFNCAERPTDPFKYHLNQSVSDYVQAIMLCGPRFADSEDSNDDVVVFANVAVDGEVMIVPGTQPFQFVDVWGNEDDLTVLCD